MDRHDHLRSKLCVICCRLAKGLITPSLEKLVEDYLIYNYTTEIKRLPNGTCLSCRRKLYYIGSGNYNHPLPEIFDYSPMKTVRIPRHDECKCMLCVMAFARHKFVAETSICQKSGNPNFTQLDPPRGLEPPLL